MRKKRKKRPLIKPKREYHWLGAVWIGGISIFLTANLLIEGQYTLGQPDGTLITTESHPLTFWMGVGFPALIAVAMIMLVIRGELRFREQLKEYHRYEAERQTQ